MTRIARNNDAALSAFLARKEEIDTMLARLLDLSDDHFGADPELIGWGHVGDLEGNAALLRRITDAAFCEGEFVG